MQVCSPSAVHIDSFCRSPVSMLAVKVEGITSCSKPELFNISRLWFFKLEAIEYLQISSTFYREL